jgi:hypothetical protein
MITIACKCCEDGVIWRSWRGGIDPDAWPVPCEECGGTGEIELVCDLCCSAATRRVTDQWGDDGHYCDACFAEVMADTGHDGMPDLGEPGEP